MFDLTSVFDHCFVKVFAHLDALDTFNLHNSEPIVEASWLNTEQFGSFICIFCGATSAGKNSNNLIAKMHKDAYEIQHIIKY